MYYSKDYAYIRIAKEISKFSTYKQHHIGCLCVIGNRIVSSGYNCNRSDPLQKELNKLRFVDDDTTGCVHSLHAEVMCLKPIMGFKKPKLSKAKLYLYREQEGKYALSRPCVGCMKLIDDLGIKTIYYTGDCNLLVEDVRTHVIRDFVGREVDLLCLEG